VCAKCYSGLQFNLSLATEGDTALYFCNEIHEDLPYQVRRKTYIAKCSCLPVDRLEKLRGKKKRA